MEMEIINKHTAGLCDTCNNCISKQLGDGITEPFGTVAFCSKKALIIEPALEHDTENQTLECELYELD